MLYKTRIQFSMIFAVVITLVLVGIITFVSISTQYQSQQDKNIRDKIMRISVLLENGPIAELCSRMLPKKASVEFDKLADNYATDLTLYDLDGVIKLFLPNLRYTTMTCLLRRMNGQAYIALKDEQKSEFVNEERISGLTYKAAYAPCVTRNIE
jgi:two-component system nitrogen regulation sensor histidine kinase NtrY